MHERIDVRFAGSADKQDVLRLLDEIGEEINRTAGYSPRNVEAQAVGGAIFDAVVQREDTMIFLAVAGTEVVGLVTFFILPNVRHGGYRGHIEDVVVSAKARGQGVGSALIDAVKEYCQSKNIRVFKLDSVNELADAHRFYEKNGGRQTEKMFRFDV